VATYREALAAEALACLGVLEAKANELQPATEDLLAALALWRELGEPHREADSLNRLGLIYKDTQGTEKARESLESALALWQRLGERADEAETRGNLCLLELDRGSLPAALSCFQENLAFFHALGVKKEEAGTLHNIGAAYGLLGEPDKALASYEQALALCHALGDGYGEAEALNNIAVVHRTLGEWQEALRLYGEAREVLAPLADRALEATLLNNSGFIYTSVGEHERALAYNVTLCVNGTASCITKPVTIPAAPPVPVISGPANLCNGLTATYSVPIVAGATYSWTVTNGTINGSATGHSVHVTWNATGGGQITVVVTNAKGCSSRATLKVEDCSVWLDKCCVDMKVDAIAPPPQDLGNGVYALAPKVTAPGNTVIRVVADVISTQRTFFAATCGPNGPVSSVVVNASAVSSFTPSFLSSSREVIWHSGPAVNLGAGLTFPFQIQFPPMLSPSCSETLDFCVKYTVTNAGCRSCEIIRCYSILRTGQPVPNDLPN